MLSCVHVVSGYLCICGHIKDLDVARLIVFIKRLSVIFKNYFWFFEIDYFSLQSFYIK